jgi:hypothetical protein
VAASIHLKISYRRDETTYLFNTSPENASFPTHYQCGRLVILAREEEDRMTPNRPSPLEPSPDVLDFLKEAMSLSFPLVKDRSPDLITTRIHHGKVCVDVWSITGEWVMSSEDSVEKIIRLEEELRKDPGYRAEKLAFVAGVVAMQRPRKRFLWW